MLSQKILSPTSIKATGLLALSAVSVCAIIIRKLKSINGQKRLEEERKQRLIVITGCDSGFGYSMAVWGARMGYKVLAGCLHENGEGAQKLRRQFPDFVTVVGLNVTDPGSLENFHGVCKQMLETNNAIRLWALIANAGICTIGEFFWQTQRQKESQMDVNFWGAVNFITRFRNLLFEAKARVIIISSDCSEYPFPFLSTYCASKAALNTWAQSFRLEVAKYGVSVVAFHPRDFSMNSGLFSNLEQQYHQMSAEMSEQERNFYGDYFDKFMKAKQEVFARGAQEQDQGIKKKAIKPLNNCHKKPFVYLLESDVRNISVYRDADLLTKVFHLVCTVLPQRHSDKIVSVLLNPDYKTIYWQENKQGNSQQVE